MDTREDYEKLMARGLGRPLTARERADAERRQYFARTPHTFIAAPQNHYYCEEGTLDEPEAAHRCAPPICLQCGLIEEGRHVPLEGEPYSIHVKRVKELDAPGMY